MNMTEIVKEYMRKIVLWREMYETCINRPRCKGCPYEKNQTCDKETTSNVLRSAADIFQEFLEDEEKP